MMAGASAVGTRTHPDPPPLEQWPAQAARENRVARHLIDDLGLAANVDAFAAQFAELRFAEHPDAAAAMAQARDPALTLALTLALALARTRTRTRTRTIGAALPQWDGGCPLLLVAVGRLGGDHVEGPRPSGGPPLLHAA